MSIISKLGFVPMIVPAEPQTDSTEIQQGKSPVLSTGVANITDAFESVSPLQNGIVTYPQPQPPSEDQLLQTEVVDASKLFDSLTEVQDPQLPAGIEPAPKIVNDETTELVVEFTEPALDRVSDRLNNLNTKMELHKAEQQDAEARTQRSYTSLDDWLKEMRK